MQDGRKHVILIVTEKAFGNAEHWLLLTISRNLGMKRNALYSIDIHSQACRPRLPCRIASSARGCCKAIVIKVAVLFGVECRGDAGSFWTRADSK